MDDDLPIKLRKNKIDLQHKVLLQNQQIVLAFGIGFPLTIANIIISMNFIPNQLELLIIIAMVASCLGGLAWFIERNNQKIRATQNQIDLLLQEIQHAD